MGVTSGVVQAGPFRVFLWMVAVLLLATATPAGAIGKTVLVIGPHEDDEVLLAAGRIRSAVLAGDRVKVVLVTNGDSSGTAVGLARQAESVAAAELLGLTEQDVVFLGYGDGSMLTLYRSSSGSQVFRSYASQTATYGNRGLGGMEWHRHRTGSPAPYTRDAVLGDFQDLFQFFLPDEIYTVSTFDTHSDHQATALFVAEALVNLRRGGVPIGTRLYQGIIWAPANGNWPDPSGLGGCAGATPYTEPRWAPHPAVDWSQALRFPAPAEMQASDPLFNLKCQAIQRYPSQVTPFLLSFARKDEVFWLNDFGLNQALTATATASSEDAVAGQTAAKAIDGVIDGDGGVVTAQWTSSGQLAGAWLQLDWPGSVRVAHVNLHDRPSTSENILAGTLAFSDGSSVTVGALPVDGRPLTVTFTPRDVTWVRFTVESAQGTAAGLSEFQVLGLPATSTANAPPIPIGGPAPSASSITASQTVSLTFAATDVNGDPLQFGWVVDGGTVTGSGDTATFTPPAVSTTTVFTITAEARDGRGGSTSNSTFVTVSPGGTAPPPPPPPTPPPGGNLLRSPNAIGATPWAHWGNVSTTVNFASAPDGTQTASRAVVSAAGGHALVQPSVGVSPSTAYVFSFYARNNGGTAASYSVYDTTHGSDIVFPTSYVSRISGSGWTLVSVPFTTPAGCTSINVYPVRDSGFPVDVLLWGASLVAGTTPPVQVTGTLALAPATVLGGQPSTGTVSLSSPAAAGGVLVTLSSSNPGAASVPASVTIPAGAVSAIVTVTTAPVAAATTASITATFPGGSSTAQLQVTEPPPAGVSTLAFSPTTLVGGNGAQAVVTLSSAAGAQGATVELSASAPAMIGFPSSVIVPAGATSVTFSISTATVTSSTPVTVTATAGGTSASASLSLLPLLVSSVAIAPASVVGGSPATGTVTLSGAAPFGGASVQLSSNAPSVVSVPGSVLVLSGTTSATFPVATTAQAGSTTASITASYGSSAASATLGVTSTSVAVSTLVLSPARIVGGSTSTGTVTLAAPAPAGGTPVTITSSNTTTVTVPASVTVPAGALTTTFPITAASVTAGTSATISVGAGGVTRTATLSVRALTLTASPTTLAGGAISTGTVRLSGVVDTATVVTLAASSGAPASTPPSVTIAAGSTSATFVIQTSPVAVTTSVSVTARSGTASRSVTLSVRNPTASSVVLSPTTVTGGATSTATVTISIAAPPGGSTVTLTSSKPSTAAVPTQVTVPAGVRSATFPVTTSPVPATTTASIRAALGGVTRSSTLTVSP